MSRLCALAFVLLCSFSFAEQHSQHDPDRIPGVQNAPKKDVTEVGRGSRPYLARTVNEDVKLLESSGELKEMAEILTTYLSNVSPTQANRLGELQRKVINLKQGFLILDEPPSAYDRGKRIAAQTAILEQEMFEILRVAFKDVIVSGQKERELSTQKSRKAKTGSITFREKGTMLQVSLENGNTYRFYFNADGEIYAEFGSREDARKMKSTGKLVPALSSVSNSIWWHGKTTPLPFPPSEYFGTSYGRNFGEIREKKLVTIRAK